MRLKSNRIFEFTVSKSIKIAFFDIDKRALRSYTKYSAFTEEFFILERENILEAVCKNSAENVDGDVFSCDCESIGADFG